MTTFIIREVKIWPRVLCLTWRKPPSLNFRNGVCLQNGWSNTFHTRITCCLQRSGHRWFLTQYLIARCRHLACLWKLEQCLKTRGWSETKFNVEESKCIPNLRTKTPFAFEAISEESWPLDKYPDLSNFLNLRKFCMLYNLLVRGSSRDGSR